MIRQAIATVVALTASAAPAFAGEPLQVTSRVLVEARARATDGSTATRLVTANRVVPGDRIVIELSYRNTGAQPLADVVIANPLPATLTYRAPAEGSPAPEVSVDGRTFAPLAALRVVTATGPRAATPADVTHLRWRLAHPLAAGAQGQFAFQANLK